MMNLREKVVHPVKVGQAGVVVGASVVVVAHNPHVIGQSCRTRRVDEQEEALLLQSMLSVIEQLST